MLKSLLSFLAGGIKAFFSDDVATDTITENSNIIDKKFVVDMKVKIFKCQTVWWRNSYICTA